jgi:signal transduction histidine kinase/ActR/RegA family two-component response regulator
VQLSAIREVQPLLAEVARVLHTTFGYYQVNVVLVEGEELVVQASCGAINDLTQFTNSERFPVSRGLTGWAARSGDTLLVNDVRHDERFVSHPLLADTRAELAVPIKLDGVVYGVINIESNVLGGFNQSDMYVAEALAGQAAVALENIRRYEELKLTQQRLVHSERLRALGELSSGIAHDFNNLLTSILGHTQLLLIDATDPTMAEGLQIIERAALDGAATVRRLQSYAQINQAAPEEPVSLNLIVEESLAITRPRWRDATQSQGIQLAVERDLRPLPELQGDGAALREAVTNLILNALDAMPAGGTLRLRTAPAPRVNALGRTAALFEISDTGLGMAEEVRARIFEPFFSTKGPRGNGMGLAMVYSTVQRHGGSIEVRSAPGEGSRFSLLLPVEPRGVSQSPATLPAAPAQIFAMQVLVVEDDPAVRQVLAELLHRLGHKVDAVESGETALARLGEHRYDLLCSDLGMPGMSGWDLVRRARALYPDLLIVLITGWGDQISPEDARRNDVDQVMAKPFDALRLRQMLEALVARRGATS